MLSSKTNNGWTDRMRTLLGSVPASEGVSVGITAGPRETLATPAGGVQVVSVGPAMEALPQRPAVDLSKLGEGIKAGPKVSLVVTEAAVSQTAFQGLKSAVRQVQADLNLVQQEVAGDDQGFEIVSRKVDKQGERVAAELASVDEWIARATARLEAIEHTSPEISREDKARLFAEFESQLKSSIREEVARVCQKQQAAEDLLRTQRQRKQEEALMELAQSAAAVEQLNRDLLDTKQQLAKSVSVSQRLEEQLGQTQERLDADAYDISLLAQELTAVRSEVRSDVKSVSKPPQGPGTVQSVVAAKFAGMADGVQRATGTSKSTGTTILLSLIGLVFVCVVAAFGFLTHEISVRAEKERTNQMLLELWQKDPAAGQATWEAVKFQRDLQQ